MYISGPAIRRMMEENEGTYRDRRGRYSISPAMQARIAKKKADQKAFDNMMAFALIGWAVASIVFIVLSGIINILIDLI